MRWWIAAGLCLTLGGCAASTEVKQASVQIGLSLAELREAQAELRSTYLSELEKTRRIVGRAIVAAAVTNEVRELSEEELAGDLNAISSAIQGERKAYRSLVDAILKERLRVGESDSAVVRRVLSRRSADARRLAVALDLSGQAKTAAELLRRAEVLDGLESSGNDQYGDMLSLVTLARTQQAVRQGMADLEAYVEFLQIIHTQVNEWISTDVSVSGSEVASLIERAGRSQGSGP